MPDQWETPRAYYDFTVGLINTNLTFGELLNDSTIFDSTSDVIYVSHFEDITRQGAPDSLFNINLESAGIEFPNMEGLNGPYDIPVPNISQDIPIDLSNSIDMNNFTDCFPKTLASSLLPATTTQGSIDELDYVVENEIFRIKQITSDSGGWTISVTNNLPFPITLDFSLNNGSNSLLDTGSDFDNIEPYDTKTTTDEITENDPQVINLNEDLSYEITAGAIENENPSNPCQIYVCLDLPTIFYDDDDCEGNCLSQLCIGEDGWPLEDGPLGVDFALDYLNRLKSVVIDRINIQDSISTGFELPVADGFTIKKAILAESALVPPGSADPDTNMLLLDINNETPIEINLEFELFNFWEDDNGWINLSDSGIMEPNSSISPDDAEGQIDFYGFTMVKNDPDLELEPIDSVRFKMIYDMNLEEDYTIEVIENQITFGIEFNSIEIRNMHIDLVVVEMENMILEIPSSSTTLGSLPDEAYNIEIMDLILEVVLFNEIGIPINIDLDIEGIKNGFETVSFPLDLEIGAPINNKYDGCIFNEVYDIEDDPDSVLTLIKTNKDYLMTELYCDASVDTSITEPDLTNMSILDGNNGSSLVDIINFMPENINVGGEVVIDGEGTFSKGAEVWGSYSLTTPLSFIYKQSITMLMGANLMEPMDQTVKDDIDSTLIQGTMHLQITNRTPVSGALSLLISDSTIFPLFLDSLVTGPWNEQLDFNTAIWDTLDPSLEIDSVSFTAVDASVVELRASEVKFFNNDTLQFFITRLIDVQFPQAEYADSVLIDPGIYTTDVIIDSSLLDLLITDQPRYSNAMVNFDGSPLGIDGSYIPITLQTTNAIDIQAVLTIQLDTGSLDIEP